MKGLVHIYTGDGKGKTTAAVGLGIRAYGRGFKVLMVQFLKNMESGELNTIKRLGPDFSTFRGKGISKFTWQMNDEELLITKQDVRKIFEYAVEAASSGIWDMLILDEVMASVTTGLLDLKDVTAFIKNKPDKLEIVMTGRNAPWELIELSDYVSQIKAVKHPMEKGIAARKGIED